MILPHPALRRFAPLLLAIPAMLHAADPTVRPDEIAPGPFAPTDASLRQNQYPEWFRDAKFGIWAHWGPQAVPRQGDWYARKMYQNTEIDRKTGEKKGQHPVNKFHVETYGHPSKFGYKEIIARWKAERFEPDALMALYKRVGAKYFVSMATHHDNYFLWDSKIHRWNAAKVGPGKDILGLFKKAAEREGLRFGISEHLGASFTWFQPSHGADESGPMAGVPYDGNDPQFQDLYHKKAAPDDTSWLTKNPEFHRRWFDCVKEAIDLYQPDLVYSDSSLPFGDVGRSLVAHFYNSNIARHGKQEAVYNCKQDSEGRWVRDIERGVTEGIQPHPWQTDTSIGDWYYRTGQKYMTGGEVVRMLVDIASKNGNLLLNVVQTPEGDLEPDVLAILDEIATWIAANGEGVYATRPWKVYGEGPSTRGDQEKGKFGGLKDVPSKGYTPEDFRFTTSKDGRTLYAFAFGIPPGAFRIASLGTSAKIADRPVASVERLGPDGTVKWKQEADALVIDPPANFPSRAAVGFRIRFAE